MLIAGPTKVRTATAADTGLANVEPDDNRALQIREADRVICGASLVSANPAHAATVDFYSWDAGARAWFRIPAAQIVLTAPGAAQVSIDHPGGSVLGWCASISSGATVTIIAKSQRSKH